MGEYLKTIFRLPKFKVMVSLKKWAQVYNCESFGAVPDTLTPVLHYLLFVWPWAYHVWCNLLFPQFLICGLEVKMVPNSYSCGADYISQKKKGGEWGT